MEEGRYIYDSLADDDYDGLPPDDSLSLEEEATDAGDAPVMGLLVAPALVLSLSLRRPFFC